MLLLFYYLLLSSIPKRCISNNVIPWTYLHDSTYEATLSLPHNHFDLQDRKSLPARFWVVRDGAPKNHLFVLPGNLGDGLEKTQMRVESIRKISLANTWYYMMEQRGLLAASFDSDPHSFSLQNAAMDVVSFAKRLQADKESFRLSLYGEEYGSLLGYLAYRLGAADTFIGALFVNFQPSMSIAHPEIDILPELKRVCTRDQECQSLWFELDQWSPAFREITKAATYCSSSIEMLVDRVSEQHDVRQYIRRASLLLSRKVRHQNPAVVLAMLQLAWICPNVKVLSRFAKTLLPAGIPIMALQRDKSTSRRLIEEFTEAAITPSTPFTALILRSELQDAEKQCSRQHLSYIDHMVSECDQIFLFDENGPTYVPLRCFPAKLEDKTRVLVISGALNMDYLVQNARNEFPNIPSPNKLHLIFNNYGTNPLASIPCVPLIFSYLFSPTTDQLVSALHACESTENARPIDWLVKHPRLASPLHVVHMPDVCNWLLWAAVFGAAIILPTLHFAYIYINS